MTAVKEAMVIYWMQDAPQEDHPQTNMKRLSDNLGFKILGAVPQSAGDQWWFWIEYEAKPKLPDYVKETEWLPIGTC